MQHGTLASFCPGWILDELRPGKNFLNICFKSCIFGRKEAKSRYSYIPVIAKLKRYSSETFAVRAFATSIICPDQSVTFVKMLLRMNVRIYSYQQNYTNEYPNIFILIYLTRMNVRIGIRIENCTNIRIYSNIRLGFTF